MAQLGRAQGVADLNQVSADKVYGLFKNSISRLAELCPQNFKSLELPGGVLQAGAVFSARYILIEGSPAIADKVKIEALDDAKRTISFEISEGDTMQFYKSFKGKLEIGPGFAKWTIEGEKKASTGPSVDAYVDFGVRVCKGLDTRLA